MSIEHSFSRDQILFILNRVFDVQAGDFGYNLKSSKRKALLAKAFNARNFDALLQRASKAPVREADPETYQIVHSNRDVGSSMDGSIEACPHCKADLTQPNSVVREYVNKRSGDEDDGNEDVMVYGHYHNDFFEPDTEAAFDPSSSYDLADDSDKCCTCDGQL